MSSRERILLVKGAAGLGNRMQCVATALVYARLTLSEGTPTANVPLRAGKGWLYEGGIREPMIIKWPGVTRPGSICSEPVTSTGFYPTMLEMAGLRLRPDQHSDGVSLAPMLRQSGGH